MHKKASAKLWIIMALSLITIVAGIIWIVSSQKSKIKNVLLISIDTCRADYLSCYGYERPTTPNIDQLAEQGLLFTNAVTPIPLTLPAHCSIMTGQYPPTHQVHENLNQKLAPSFTTLAEILKENGFYTAAIISSFVLNHQFGMNQGFDLYNDTVDQQVGPTLGVERGGAEATYYASQFLQQHPEDPFFLFLHYYDPHTDYEPPEPFATQYADNLYAGEIAFVDQCIDQIIEELKTQDLFDSTLIIIFGDHGEALGDHGEAEHGYYLYESTIKVPLIIRSPDNTKAAKIDNVVSLIDIAPTILSYLNIPDEYQLPGMDLSAFHTNNAPAEPRTVFCESLMATKYGCNPLLGITNEKWKFIQTTNPELYDLAADPDELKNLIDQQEQRHRLLEQQLIDTLTAQNTSPNTDSHIELDEAALKQLESLGYVGGNQVDSSFELDPNKKDPKDLIQYHEKRQKITYLIYHKDFTPAKEIGLQLLEDWPQMNETFSILGRVCFEKGDYEESITYNKKFVELAAAPNNNPSKSLVYNQNKPLFLAHSLLGSAYDKLEQYESAVKHFQDALEIKSDQPNTYNNLATSYFHLGNFELAIQSWRYYLQLSPNSAETHNNIAGAYYKLEQYDNAIASWNQVLDILPNWTEVRQNLALLHNQLAQSSFEQQSFQPALEHWNQVLRLTPNNPDIYNKIALAHFSLQQLEQALVHWQKTLDLIPDSPDVMNNLSWILATIDNQLIRNPKKALSFSLQAAKLTQNQNPSILDTLSVAYAADGNFPKAIATAQSALQLAQDQNNIDLTENIRQHIQLFTEGKIVK